MTWSPTIIGIGAEKSATTWAWTMLNEHPDVCMSQPKELNYFNIDENYSRGESWYRKHFAVITACTGEISPLYMDDLRAAERIRHSCPTAKILVMLRNPFDRAMSHLFHDASVIYGNVAKLTPIDLQVLVRKDEKYIRRSCYASQLVPVLKHFSEKQTGVFFFDDVTANGLRLAQRLYEFARRFTRFRAATVQSQGKRVTGSQASAQGDQVVVPHRADISSGTCCYGMDVSADSNSRESHPTSDG